MIQQVSSSSLLFISQLLVVRSRAFLRLIRGTTIVVLFNAAFFCGYAHAAVRSGRKLGTTDGQKELIITMTPSIMIPPPPGLRGPRHEDPNSITSARMPLFGARSSGATLVVLPPYGKKKNRAPPVKSTVTYNATEFPGCTSVVAIPYGVTAIPDHAFLDCESLTALTIANSVTTIDLGAFMNCVGLVDIIIPNSVSFIGDAVFMGCTSLKTIIIPSSVTSLGDYIFYECSSLMSVSLPDSIESIGISMFDRCLSLTDVSIPISVKSINAGAFHYCPSLTEITIPHNVTSIGNTAFANCFGLRTINIQSSTVPIIEEFAFMNDKNLECIKTSENSIADALIASCQGTCPSTRRCSI